MHEDLRATMCWHLVELWLRATAYTMKRLRQGHKDALGQLCVGLRHMSCAHSVTCACGATSVDTRRNAQLRAARTAAAHIGGTVQVVK